MGSAEGITEVAERLLKTGQVLRVVKAIYPFILSNDEELTFEKGDVIYAIEKPENDPEW